MRHEWPHEDGRLAVYGVDEPDLPALEFLGRGGIYAVFPDDPTVWLDCLREILRLAQRVKELEGGSVMKAQVAVACMAGCGAWLREKGTVTFSPEGHGEEEKMVVYVPPCPNCCPE